MGVANAIAVPIISGIKFFGSIVLIINNRVKTFR